MRINRFLAQLAVALTLVVGAVAQAFAAPTGAPGGDPPETGYGRPLDVSLDGYRSDWGFKFITVAISILFIIMVAMIIWAMVMHRDRPGHKALYDHGMGKRHLMLTAGVAGAIFIGIDGTALFHAYEDITEAFFKFPTAEEHPIEVEVFAQQWAWNFRYPGPDGKFGTADDVVTLNDLRLPVGRPVLVKMKSKDVIHSFYLPNFRTKQDIFPGAITKIWFQAKAEGHFEIGCAQHCGANHYKMRGFLTITSQDEFDRWQKQQSADAQRRYDEADADAHWAWDWEI
jgi:cytochrome c oxidase subunit 2